MKNQSAKIIVAIAIGIIVGALVGIATMHRTFYYFYEKKVEISEHKYWGEKYNNNDYISMEYEINLNTGLAAGLIASSSILLYFFIPGIRIDQQEDSRRKQVR